MESESDKIFLTLLNEVKNLCIDSVVSCKGNTKLFREAESIKEYLKAKDIYIVFDSDNQKRETKVQEIKKQLQENPEEEYRLNDEEFNQIKIFLLPENDESQHNHKYCELEHLLEKMAKESKNKAFYTSFRQRYDTLFDEIFEETNQNQIPIRREQKKKKKKRAKCWLHPYITLSICLKRGFIPCGMDDLDPTDATAKIAEQRNTEILKKLFNFDLKKLQALIDFLR
ncbi:hypothetical protein HPPC_07945 [Helicobacter pylori PeCan4]|uniref:hypothetical protein n=1 Tax=Helicobacter pylori TaxID=210 RepID=UPI0001E58A9A|nr:hypothetical protein [Helicobacter pylori]ADO07787.1 hypothetical protein HPPC_07945 [Helicobacter pylori PeCan4]